jgi:hypothetical protein
MKIYLENDNWYGWWLIRPDESKGDWEANLPTELIAEYFNTYDKFMEVRQRIYLHLRQQGDLLPPSPPAEKAATCFLCVGDLRVSRGV